MVVPADACDHGPCTGIRLRYSAPFLELRLQRVEAGGLDLDFPGPLQGPLSRHVSAASPGVQPLLPLEACEAPEYLLLGYIPLTRERNKPRLATMLWAS
jgi:hypothetical protein